MSDTVKEDDKANRSDAILKRKFYQYLLPAMLTIAAFSLSEFVDSMIVANLLGSGAMAVVQLGSPVMLICAALYVLIGNGGSTLYSIYRGRRDDDSAGGMFGLSVLCSAAAGTVLAAAGLVFFKPIFSLLCTNEELKEEFGGYLFVLLFSIPFLVTIMSLVSFLAPGGAPGLATAVNIAANVVNIVMDAVYIGVFGMGVVGAAWATLTGYLVGGAVLIYAFASKKADIRVRRPRRADRRLLREMIKTGSPFSASQLGFALKFTLCNSLAQLYGAKPGIVALSLCMQSLSIVSVFLGAVVEASSPLVGMLYGENDRRGVKLLMRRAMLLQFALSGACVLFFELAPAVFAGMYGITDPAELMPAVRALRIFSLMYLIRGAYMVFMKYLQIIGKRVYSLVIGLADGFMLTVPISLLLCPLAGIDGLWWSFPLTSLTVTAVCIPLNLFIAKRSGGRFRGVFLEREPDGELVLDITTGYSDREITDASENVRKVCGERGAGERASMLAALLVEETALYLRGHGSANGCTDIMVRVREDSIVLDIRSIGELSDPNISNEADISENIAVLRGMAKSIENNYIMGMNSIRVELGRE
ncbi:MAG: polysaccharide biosynthesis C-terminal domain-containing protein, partial [Ruminiclostridium sp.]|nr:polysaccharide biosynthesis C-terminal domain-containing protein [Ruminiclostridium sp.]